MSHLHNNRTSHRELPTASEMAKIAAAEAQRPHAPGKDGIRYVDFKSIIAVYRHFKLKTDIFEFNVRDPQHILDQGKPLIAKLVSNIQSRILTSADIEILQSAYDYLAETDTPEVSDCIFVFGSKTPLRIQPAIDLYKKGLSSLIFISGRGPFYGTSTDITEAAAFKSLAIEAGVPDKAILIEDESITFADNIRRSLTIMDERSLVISSMILINSPYTQRRGWCMWRKYLPDSVTLYRINCSTGPRYNRDNWYRNEDGLNVVLGEFIKLRNAVAFDDV